MIEQRPLKNGRVRYRYRWREGGRYRCKTFPTASAAEAFQITTEARRALGAAYDPDAGKMSLSTYVVQEWGPQARTVLANRTATHYAYLYDAHIHDHLGGYQLRELNSRLIAKWQADRLDAGAGRVAVRQALTLLGAILRQAHEDELIPRNPQRVVRKARPSRRAEVRPLAPCTIELLRRACNDRDRALISVLAYGGLRPGEALALQWGDIREATILVERALSLGEVEDTKNTMHRTVRLLPALTDDLNEWRQRTPHETAASALLFPHASAAPWTKNAWDAWRAKRFKKAVEAAGLQSARPYDLRHSFASLLLHEGRDVIYVARQLGHSPVLTLRTYGHVIEELVDMPQLPAHEAIAQARSKLAARPELVAA